MNPISGFRQKYCTIKDPPLTFMGHVQHSCYLLKQSVILLKVTRHACLKNSQNLHLLDILVCNSVNKPSFQNPTKTIVAQCSLLAESHARMSRRRRFLLILKHTCLVKLNFQIPINVWSLNGVINLREISLEPCSVVAQSQVKQQQSVYSICSVMHLFGHHLHDFPKSANKRTLKKSIH